MISAAHCKAYGITSASLGGNTIQSSLIPINPNEIEIHERFKELRQGDFYEFDFMIIKLGRDISRYFDTGKVVPLRLPSHKMDDSFLTGRKLIVTGFGTSTLLLQNRRHTKSNDTEIRKYFSKKLRIAEVLYLRKNTCQTRYAKIFNQQQESANINIDQGGSSMACASSCAEDELRDCLAHSTTNRRISSFYRPVGSCLGDDGGILSFFENI